MWRSAEVFLATHPTFSDSACRFDVALVHYQRQVENGTQPEAFAPTLPTIRLGQALSVGGCRLTLRDYLPGAFGQ
ncbi:MAG: hypothetical protein HC881_19185 [Leptolyngbyaceae cyanobacterium SL_7_1]|nr:hypothetical protein [Leptolyngbyaceae cyanobacterium SL_7_1]